MHLQDMFDPDDKIQEVKVYPRPSIVVAMKKLKLKEDEDGNKVSDVRGIPAGCKVMKTRYAKTFEGVQVKIPMKLVWIPTVDLLTCLKNKDYL